MKGLHYPAAACADEREVPLADVPTNQLPSAIKWQVTLDHEIAGATAKRRQSPGTPLKVWTPRSSNTMPEPTTKSFTVLETRTSPGIAFPATRLPMCTA